jgi:hypothetical protein
MNNYEEEKFYIDSKDEEILGTFKAWKKESQSYHDEMLPMQKLAEEYYKGNQTDRDSIPDYLSNTVENRIFESIETIAPICTSTAHHFLVLPGSENEISVKKANNLSKVLERKYQTLEMQRKLEQTTRNMCLYRFGIMKWCWDEVKDDVDVKVIDPRLVLIPKMRLDPHDLPYKIEIQDYTRDEIEDYFPKVKTNELAMVEISIDVGETKNKKKVYRVYEVWANDMVAWICNDKILDKKANPYWDFEGEEKAYIDLESKKPKMNKRLVFSNHLDRPTDPYVFFTTFDVSDGPIGAISLVEVVIPLQDAINVQKRQIIDNLRRMGNGQVLIDADAMSQEDSENITNEIGLVIRGEGIASQNKIKRVEGLPLPASHFDNLTHTETMFDNIMGVHGATRGVTNAPTLGQDMMSRQQDYTRIDLFTRILNRGVARVANGLVQLMRMYYDETKVIKILGEEGAVEFIKMNSDDIEDWIEIEVRSGQSLPMDKVSIRTEAVQLWQLGALDPTSLFERLDFTNPAKYAERLIAWKQGQLTAETQQQIQLASAQNQMAAQSGMQQTAAASVGKVAEIKAKGEEDVRKVETSANVKQRAQANLGGGSPSLPKTPKLSGQKQKK